MHWRKVISGYATSPPHLWTCWGVLWWLRVPWELSQGFFMEGTSPSCAFSSNSELLILFPATSASNLCLLSQSMLPFLLVVCLSFSSPLNLLASVLNTRLTPDVIGMGLQISINQLEYTNSWVLGTVILLPEKSLQMLRVLFLSSCFQIWCTKHGRDGSWSVHGLLITYRWLQVKVKVVKPIRRYTLCTDTSVKS